MKSAKTLLYIFKRFFQLGNKKFVHVIYTLVKLIIVVHEENKGNHNLVSILTLRIMFSQCIFNICSHNHYYILMFIDLFSPRQFVKFKEENCETLYDFFMY